MSTRIEMSTEIDLLHRKLPPVAYIGMVTLALVVSGGVYLASNLPHHVSLAPAVALLVAGAALLLADLVLLARIRHFAWDKFFMVGGRALLAYIVTAGMIEYVFVYDHTHGAVLGILTAMLVVFAVDVPLMMAFTVARYQEPKSAS